MIREETRKNLFGNKSPFLMAKEEIKQHLKKHNLWDKEKSFIPYPDIKPPQIMGSSLNSHFHNIGFSRFNKYAILSKVLANSDLISFPTKWEIREGWTKYDNQTGQITSIKYPDCESVVFDVEALNGEFPTLAIAASPKAWYCWLSPFLIGISDTQRHLIRLKSSVIVGHHVGFDRARILDQYQISPPDSYFIDTLSLHVGLCGLTSHQRAKWLKLEKLLKQEYFYY